MITTYKLSYARGKSQERYDEMSERYLQEINEYYDNNEQHLEQHNYNNIKNM
jgi:hypothetical protein